jgi:hypothetical protein
MWQLLLIKKILWVFKVTILFKSGLAKYWVKINFYKRFLKTLKNKILEVIFSVLFVFETWKLFTIRSKAYLPSSSNVPKRSWPVSVKTVHRSWPFHERFRPFETFLWLEKLRTLDTHVRSGTVNCLKLLLSRFKNERNTVNIMFFFPALIEIGINFF